MAFDNNPHDDDFDGNPGSSENSEAFDRRYNRDGYSEFTNRPDMDDWQEFLYAEKDQAVSAHQQQLREAMTRVQYWPHAGRFIIPRQNTYAAHLALVREGNKVDIQFDPDTYLYFDKVIADRAAKPALFDPNHPDYAEYTTLRENLAVLRNDIMGIYMEDGSFDPGDEKYLPRLVQIAAEIGEALNADNRARNVVFPSLDTNIANIEAEGAAYMYEYIAERQAKPTFLGQTWAKIRDMLGQPSNQWQLPPIEQTAFSQAALLLPPPENENLAKATQHELRIRAAQQAEELRMQIDTSDTSALGDVNAMERNEAVKHGKVIIEWLRNIKFTDKSPDDLAQNYDPADTSDRDAMKLAATAFDQVMSSAQAHGVDLQGNEKILAAGHVRDVIEHTMELMAKLENPDSQADSMSISAKQPARWKELSKDALSHLMETLKNGLEEALAAIDLQSADYQQEREELAEQRVGDALAYQQAHMAHRKQRSGKGFEKQQKINRALAADDRAAGQGSFADDEGDAVRIARMKATQGQRTKKTDGSGTKEGKKKDIDESMEAKIREAKALGKDTDVGPLVDAGLDDERLKEIGRVIMNKSLQANIAASEIVDVKGGGIGLDESFQDRKNKKVSKSKPGIA